MTRLTAAALAAWLAATLAFAAEPLTPPFDLADPAIVAKGKQLYDTKCNGGCHGRNGQPGMDAPALAGRDYFTPQLVYITVVHGRPARRMPSWEGRISDEEIWQLTAYVMSLQKAKH